MTTRDHRYAVTPLTPTAQEPQLVCACGWSTSAESYFRAQEEYRQHLQTSAFAALEFQIGPSDEETARISRSREQEYEPQR